MKKIILLLLIFSTSVTSAQKIKYGIKAGLNISSLRADYLDETNAKSKTGFHSGVFVEIFQFNQNYSTQLKEVKVIQKNTMRQTFIWGSTLYRNYLI